MQNSDSQQFQYKCFNCGGIVVKTPEEAKCENCSLSWPIVNEAIIFEGTDYWGEMDSEELKLIINESSQKGWGKVIDKFYKATDERRYISIADLNRASWTSIIPVPYESTVLDVGSGLGALTHGLAYNYRKVISMEAVPSRIMFTSLRKKQEGLDNVEIIQSTVKNMPFFDDSFDLVILNGVLEWVGEWDDSAAPGDIQFNVLNKILKLLKPNGVLLIGIENRIGYSYLSGKMDHSGVGYTSLMPRKMASLYLKLKEPRHHRNIEKKKTEYRTYTYSRRGYKKILDKVGFSDITFYYPYPGYNQPYNIIPHQSNCLMTKFHMTLFNKSNLTDKINLRKSIKKLLIKTGIMNELIPSFIITAKKITTNTEEAANIENSVIGYVLLNIKEILDIHDVSDMTYSLYVRPLINKHVITVFDKRGVEKLAIAKISNIRRDNSNYAADEFNILKNITAAFCKDKQFLSSIPKPLLSKRLADNIITLETAINGEAFSDRIMKDNYFNDRKNIDNDLNIITEWLLKFYQSFDTDEQIVFRKIGKEYYSAPDLAQGQEIQDLHERTCDMLQHGDFFIKNILMRREEVCVIDWEHAAEGYPPLFDYFCLVKSLNFMLDADNHNVNFHIKSFADTFYSNNWFSEIILKYMFKLVDVLNFDKEKIADYFYDFLLVKYNCFRSETNKRDFRLTNYYKSLIDFSEMNKNKFITL